MTDYTLMFEKILEANPDRVFEALTQGRHLERWFCDAAESGARLGGRLQMKWTGEGASEHPFTGQWTGFDPPTRCVYEGGHAGYPDGRIGRIMFRLEPHGEGTRLKVQHAMPRDPRYDEWVETYREAWPAALEKLQGYLTPGTRPAAAKPAAEPEVEQS